MSEEGSPTRALTARQIQWLEHLKGWQEQGLSLKGYALAHGLSVSGLYTAKRWFKSRGIWQGREVSGPSRRAPKLIPVRVKPPMPATSSMFRIHLPNGVVVEMSGDADLARCRALVSMLSAAPS